MFVAKAVAPSAVSLAVILAIPKAIAETLPIPWIAPLKALVTVPIVVAIHTAIAVMVAVHIAMIIMVARHILRN